MGLGSAGGAGLGLGRLVQTRDPGLAGVGDRGAGVVGAAVYLPYVVLVHEHTDHWQIAAKQGVNVMVAQAVGDPDFAANYERILDQFREEGAAQVAFDPIATAKRVATNLHLIHKYALPEDFPPALIALIFLGACRTCPIPLLGER
ncbi:MAG: hypothetical protein AUJ55_02785 [Proteobacteria bacterium CG1_02_64_396]|nr:MAG: hypothetical protein AUJ55_02785 [Proteobacteria bacterium CG1_02_64_396]